jgi:hypothetical protein
MAKNFENFILGSAKVPDWFNRAANEGKVRQIFDEDGVLVETQISSGTKIYIAHEGDTIINTNYGLVVLNQQDAKKFGVQKKDEKPEVKVEKSERPFAKKKTEEKKTDD